MMEDMCFQFDRGNNEACTQIDPCSKSDCFFVHIFCLKQIDANGKRLINTKDIVNPLCPQIINILGQFSFSIILKSGPSALKIEHLQHFHC